MNREEQLDYELMKRKALEQLRSGKSLYGKDGAFAPLLKSFLDSALEAELTGHLDEDERLSGNRRNGKTSKDIKTSSGIISVQTPRDRNATFEPDIIRKRETILAESLESKIIGMYGLGMSLRDISKAYQRYVRYRDQPYDSFVHHHRQDYSRGQRMAVQAVWNRFTRLFGWMQCTTR